MFAALPMVVPRPVAFGALLALLSILFGFVLGGGFGLAEDSFKGRLAASGEAALETAYQGDVAAKDAVVAKSWDYLKRAHMHGGGIGSSALAAIAILLLLARPSMLANVSALAYGAGALLYSIFWLWAGFIAPGMGGTGAAKESLQFIAIPGAGLALIGAVGTIIAVATSVFGRRHPGTV